MGDYYFSLPHNIANDLKIIAYFKLPRTGPDIQPTGFLGPDICYTSGYWAIPEIRSDTHLWENRMLSSSLNIMNTLLFMRPKKSDLNLNYLTLFCHYVLVFLSGTFLIITGKYPIGCIVRKTIKGPDRTLYCNPESICT